MNKKLLLFFLGTKIQSFAAALYSFGFLIIFYQLTDSVLYSGSLTAITLVASRIVLFFTIPQIKGSSPVKISAYMSFLTGFTAITAIGAYKIWSEEILFYIVLAILFSAFKSIDESFQYPIIPNIVEKEYLFKANSLNGMLVNIILIAAPIGSFVFYNLTDLSGILLFYGLTCIISGMILQRIDLVFEQNETAKKKSKNKLLFFTDEWYTTLKVIGSNPQLLFCIAIGVGINLVFAGLNGPVLLKMGELLSNQVLGQTLIKIVLSSGSLIGIYGVYKLKVKENYNKYLKLSIMGLVCSLLFLGFAEQLALIYLGTLFLAIFIMFIMNATGTLIQLITPKEELPAVYAFRSTLYSVVVPLSYVLSGLFLEYLVRQYYFLFSCLLIGMIWALKGKKHDKVLEELSQ